MSQDARRNELRAMTAEEHFAYFQANGQALRDHINAAQKEQVFKQCSQESVTDLKALLHWQEFSNDISLLATDVRDYEWFLYYRENADGGSPGSNYIAIVSKETGCYTAPTVELVDYNAGLHKATPTLSAMQNLTTEPCGNTRVKMPT